MGGQGITKMCGMALLLYATGWPAPLRQWDFEPVWGPRW